MEKVGVSVIECSQPEGISSKMRGCKLRIVVYWQGAVKQRGVKQGGVKRGYLYTSSAVQLVLN
jgi:hypothetical protein